LGNIFRRWRELMTGLTITSNSAAGYYLSNAAFNPVTVASGVTITNVNSAALGAAPSTYWTIVNSGSLAATGNNAVSDGILLYVGGGAVTNATSASVTGYYAGVSVTGSGSVVNQGTIAGTATAGSGNIYTGGAFTATSAGVLLGGGGVSNAAGGMISGYSGGVAVGDGGSVVNAGTISTFGTLNGFGVLLTAGGSVTNMQDGVISSAIEGVLTFAETATVVNQGSIGARYGNGVALIAGGVVSNAAGGTIYAGRLGVYFGGTAASTLTNDGLIVGYTTAGAVLFGGGTIDNQGKGRITGGASGVYASGTAGSTVTNTGVIYGFHNIGAWLNAGGGLTNGGTIGGLYYGVQVNNAAGTVVNAGHIFDVAYKRGAGVQVVDGGVVTNAIGGIVTSEWIGVQIGGTSTRVGGTVINQGTIVAADNAGDGAGVWIHGPGAISNAANGLISGGAFGIVAYYQTTVVNQGTVFGTAYAFDAVRSGYADRIIDAPGAVFSGAVSGGNALGSAVYSTLELASGSSAGTIADVGTFVDFGQIAFDAGSTWSLGGTIVAGETITFGGPAASLILASPSAAAATISGFAATDTIQLSGITDVTGLSFGANNVLTIKESGDAGLTLQFDAPQDLTWSTGGGNTDIFDVPCFLPGTLILTDQGEVPVEQLGVGDTIVTLGGRKRRLCWIGQGRTLATRGRRNAATPVIVRKGALAANVPHRDLHITKGHALYLDDVLIPVEFLVNHRSILWDDRAQEVSVFHLELDAHDVLVANGAAAESYRDDGNRWLFRNANAGWDQPPKALCAPVLTGGAVVDAIWRRLLDRTGPRPGMPLTDDPDLHLLVDGRRVEAQEQDGPVRVFRLQQVPARVVVASRDVVPAELGLARDPRSLGVALRRAVVRQGNRFVMLEANDARLGDGFHAYEAAGDLRWTNGNATLPVGVFAGFTGGVEVVLHLAGTTRYPDYGDRAVRDGAERVAA
jgi:hypothetical protein